MSEENVVISDELNKEKQIIKSRWLLGVFLLLESALNAMETAFRVFVRYYYDEDTFKAGTYQSYASFIKLFIVAVVFGVCLYKMSKLQYRARRARQLLFIWGVILVPIQLVYDLSTIIYNRMLGMIWFILNSSYVENREVLYAMFYDSSHGFKYMGMFMAIVIGIIMTGILLERRRLVLISGVLITIFMISFAAINMHTMEFETLSLNIGLNTTSLLFHLLTTVGMFVLGLFVIRNYQSDANGGK